MSKQESDETWALYPAHIKAQYLAEEAIKKNAWLFDPQTRCWYTPEEFVAETKAFPASAEIFKVIQIRYPIDGINAGYKQIASMYEKLQELSKRVFDYYRNK